METKPSTEREVKWLKITHQLRKYHKMNFHNEMRIVNYNCANMFARKINKQFNSLDS